MRKIKAPIKTHIVFSVFISLIIVFLYCSMNGMPKPVSIFIHAHSGAVLNAEVKLTDLLNLERQIIASTRVDSSGNGALIFQIEKSTFVTIRIGDIETDGYLEPDYILNVTVKGKKFTFSGNGASINNYLYTVTALEREIENKGGVHMASLDSSAFFQRLDTLKNSFFQFHKKFMDSTKMPLNLASLMEQRNSMRILSLKQAFQWNYGVKHDFVIPDQLDISKEMPFDSAFLSNRMVGYDMLIHFNMNIKRRLLLSGVKSNAEGIKRTSELPVIIKKEIETTTYSSRIKEFLLAKNIDYWIALRTEGIDSLYSSFIGHYPNSPYMIALKNRYFAFQNIAPKQRAPIIKGISLNGDSISTKDFFGKVIYVDVWASWCGPCIKEIPNSQRLQKVFDNNESIVFLNVSIDKDSDDWRRALLQHKTWGGVHVICDGAISKSYSINSVPRYILIDKKGAIVNADALRPSSEALELEIRNLVK